MDVRHVELSSDYISMECEREYKSKVPGWELFSWSTPLNWSNHQVQGSLSAAHLLSDCTPTFLISGGCLSELCTWFLSNLCTRQIVTTNNEDLKTSLRMSFYHSNLSKVLRMNQGDICNCTLQFQPNLQYVEQYPPGWNLVQDQSLPERLQRAFEGHFLKK